MPQDQARAFIDKSGAYSQDFKNRNITQKSDARNKKDMNPEQKVVMIKEMNMNLHTQMKSPYFEAFFKLIDKNQWSDLFSYWE